LNPNVWKFGPKRIFLTVSARLDSWSRDVGKLANGLTNQNKSQKISKSIKTRYLTKKINFGCTFRVPVNLRSQKVS
jgi:hypothetical protein